MTGYQDYARTNIQTSDPRAVVVLLYEGAIRFLNQAADAQARGNRAEMSEHITKTLRIIQFLTNALDFDEGGEIADNLVKLYNYMRDALSEANIKADPEKIEEVIRLLRPLLDAWREIANDPAAAAALEQRAGQLAAAAPADGSPPEQAVAASGTDSVPGSDIPDDASASFSENGAATGVSPAALAGYGQDYASLRRAGNKASATGNTASDTAIAGRAAYGIRTAG